MPALSPRLLHGLYKDWDELIVNKETRGGEGVRVGEATALQKYLTFAGAKNNVSLFSPRAAAFVEVPDIIITGIYTM